MITAELAAVSTSFIGRNRELGEIVRLLARDSRLLTLVGPGGMGKTRLALEAARRLSTRQNGTDRQDAPTFANDVYFIPLQSLASPDFLVPAIANAVGLQCSEGGEIRRQLLDYCRPKSMLLMLKMMRRPAQAAGLSDLQHFLETGFAAFAELGDARPFLSTISARERRWIDTLFNEDMSVCTAALDAELCATDS